VIPARNEADTLPACLPSLLQQDYQGTFAVIVVDDDSADGTAKAAAAIAERAGWQVTEAAGPWPPSDRQLALVSARPAPTGWAGKVWAMSEGVLAAQTGTANAGAANAGAANTGAANTGAANTGAANTGAANTGAANTGADYLLLTDADICYQPGTLAAVAAAAEHGRFTMVSLMARLRTANRWERLLIPAFVYFFAQLYPFRRASRPGSRTAAAAGGCMLVRTRDLAAAGGLAAIAGERIDDVALARLLKGAGGTCWLGLTTDVTSVRPYDRLADIWDMIARSAYTQLRYSLALTVAVIAGLAWLYLLPPAAAIAGLALLATGTAWPASAWLVGAGAAGWLVMSVTYWPMLRLYRLSPGRAPSLPVIAALYAAMTADSARRHLAGRGGEWKGRVIQP
jgi:hopene-associated glycosyltransferase HpnB